MEPVTPVPYFCVCNPGTNNKQELLKNIAMSSAKNWTLLLLLKFFQVQNISGASQ